MCMSCAQSGLSAAESIGLEPSTTKAVSIAASAVMLFSLAAPLAAPATTVKAGAVCTKTNQKVVKAGKTFVCKKSGKKLVWQLQKRKTVNQATAPSTPTVPTVPTKPEIKNFFTANRWSTDATRQQLIESALLEVKAFVDANKGNTANFEIYYDDSILASDKVWMNARTESISKIFAKYHPDKHLSFVALTDQWIMQKSASVGAKFREVIYPCGRLTTWENYCAEKNLAAYVLKGRYEENPGASAINWPAQVKAVFAHEYFHSVQRHLHDRVVGQSPIGRSDVVPMWLWEGSATFIGMSFTHTDGAIDYYLTRTQEVDNHPDYKTTAGKSPLREFLNNWSQEPGGYKNPYGIGQVATEFIVANVGVEGLLNIFKY